MGNRQYDEMRRTAVDRLKGRDPAALAALAGAECDAGMIRLTSFGRKVCIDERTFDIEPALPMWHALTLLQYLNGADGAVPGDAWLALGDVSPGGGVRGDSFDQQVDMDVARRFSGCAPEVVIAACHSLGGMITDDTQADLTADFWLAPRYPMRLNLWYADDEFLASGKVLVNAGVRGCLGVEAAGSAAVLLVDLLAQACGK